MAINTASKRISALNQLTGMRTILPDGSIASADRQATARVYSGILATTPTIGAGYTQNDFTSYFLRRRG